MTIAAEPTAVFAFDERNNGHEHGPTSTEVSPLSPRMHLVRGIILMILVLTTSVLFHVVILSHFQQESAQQRAFSSFRSDLAVGVAPTGSIDFEGNLRPTGTPIAQLEIPAVGLEQIVLDGTSSATLLDGPGHRRDTPFPGQSGVSIVMARRGAFGGPFASISQLEPGETIVATTAQGRFEFAVIGVRHEGDPLPAPPAAGAARLVLVTATGTRYFPSGVVQVDADLVGTAAVGPPRPFSFVTLPDSEKIMAGDTSTLWAFALWLQLLTGLAVGALLSLARWGRAPTWIVFTPPMLLVGMAASSELVRILPNLL